MEKKRQIHNSIYKLCDKKGNCHTHDKDISNHCTKYYSELYKIRNPKRSYIEDYLSKITNLPTLFCDSQEQCKVKITNSESQQAIKLMKNKKAPGSDGLTIEFYKTWTDISDTLIDSFIESFNVGHLSFSKNISISSLIFIKGNPEKLKKIYSPISLTNVDYRILAFTLALRLQNVISTGVSNYLTGYIKKSLKEQMLELSFTSVSILKTIIVQGFFFLILKKHLIVLSGLFNICTKEI